MLHPSILSQYNYRRDTANPIDACADTADYFGVKVSTLAAFLRAVGIDAEHLRNL
jgi:hypothetical protein